MKKNENTGAGKNGKKRKVLTVIFVSLCAVTGLVMLLYPTVADYLNYEDSRRVINDYKKEVGKLDQSRYDEILRAARDFNNELFANSPIISELTDERREAYMHALDITGNGNGIMGYIEIERADVYLAIYHGTDEGVLHVGAGHLEGSSLPVDGENVHVVLSGHSGLPSATLFTNIDQLQTGDIFRLYVLNEVLTYQVENIQTVLPEALEKMRIVEGENLCTLMTCTPYGVNTHRLVITGRQISTPESGSADPDASVTPGAADPGWQNFKLIVIPAAIVGVSVTAVLTALLIQRRRKRKH